jgi:hypothetical protein
LVAWLQDIVECIYVLYVALGNIALASFAESPVALAF